MITFEKYLSNGVALSLAKAHTVLDVDVILAAVAAIAMSVIIRESTVAPAADVVVSRNICINGNPVGVESNASKGPDRPVQKRSITQ